MRVGGGGEGIFALNAHRRKRVGSGRNGGGRLLLLLVFFFFFCELEENEISPLLVSRSEISRPEPDPGPVSIRAVRRGLYLLETLLKKTRARNGCVSRSVKSQSARQLDPQKAKAASTQPESVGESRCL